MKRAEEEVVKRERQSGGAQTDTHDLISSTHHGKRGKRRTKRKIRDCGQKKEQSGGSQ